MDLTQKVISRDINELIWTTGLTIATAESCTAGMLSSLLVTQPGSSNYFKGGITCYSDETKTKYLNVDANVIAEQTAVCETVACQMAEGARQMFNADYAVSTTGYAGPGGGHEGTPIGTIWMAVATPSRTVSQSIFTDEGREENINAAVRAAITFLRDTLAQDLHKEATEE